MKLKLLKLASLFVFFTFILSLDGQVKIDYTNTKAKLPIDPKIKMGKLSNGLIYYIKENKKPEKRAELLLAINAGAILEDDDQDGLAHFCEHMAFNGTKNFPKNDLVSFLESTGVRFGNDLNAYTNTDETVYMLTLPTDNDDILNKGFRVLEDWSHNVTYNDQDIENERGVIREEWRLGKGAEDRIDRIQRPILFKNSKYAVRDVIGDTTIINHAPYDALRRFYHDWYRPNLMAVICVGDFDSKEIEKKIIEHFGKLVNPDNPRKREKFTVPPNKEILVSVAKDAELSMPGIEIYFKHPGREEGTVESSRQDIVENLFSTIISERLSDLTRKPNPPFIYAYARESRFVDDIRSFTFRAGAKSDGIKYALESLLTEAFRVVGNGFNESELERAKANLLRRMERGFAERDKTPSQMYAFEYLRNFLDDESIPGVETELEMYRHYLPEISLKEVNDLVHKLIKNENCVITIAAPDKPGVVVPTEAEALALYKEISNKKIEPYSDVVVDKPLLQNIPKQGTLTQEKLIKEIGVTELTLSNGVKVVLKPTDFQNDEISFQSFRFGGTSLAPDNDYYSANASSSIINQSGLGDFNRTQLSKKLTGKVARVMAAINTLDEEISGTCSPNDIETMFQLIYSYFIQPRKDKESFEAYIEKLKSQIKDSKNSPRAVLNDTFRVTLGNYHFRSLPTTEKTVEKINLDKAIEFYKQRFSNANGFTFFFAGNFDVEKIKPFILTYLASLPSKKEIEKWKDIGMKSPKGSISKVVKKGIEAQSLVRLVFSGDYVWNEKNNFDFSALMDVFDIKLREVMREDKGGVYGVGAWQNTEKFPREEYSINIAFGCDPKRVDELINAVLDVMKDMTMKKPDSTYLNKVKEIQKREYEVNMKENWYWLNSLYNAYYYNENPVNILKESAMIDKLSADDVFDAAKMYFKTNNYIRVVLMPEDK
ncbi:MAG: insulinase family protein [Bacteroidetes bacterium]|nr:MAG: insulinase family protein [Bacteroidota bacterium]